MLDYGPDQSGHAALLHYLPDTLRERLRSQTREVRYRPGNTICLQGDPTRTLKIVLDGWVKLYRLSPDGDEAVITTLTSGRSFDEVSALQGGHCDASADAVTACRVMHLDLGGLGGCDETYRAISGAVMRATSDHLGAMINHVEQLKTSSAWERLADFLLTLAPEEAHGPCEFSLPFEKKLVAAMLGIKPESLSRAFNRLRIHGVTSSLNGIVKIKDVTKLRDLRGACSLNDQPWKAA